jgi:hypothetical protein
MPKILTETQGGGGGDVFAGPGFTIRTPPGSSTRRGMCVCPQSMSEALTPARRGNICSGEDNCTRSSSKSSRRYSRSLRGEPWHMKTFIFEDLSGRKTGQPVPVAAGQLRLGEAVGRPHFGGRAINQLAVVVSANVDVAFGHQQVGCGGCLQRTRQVIAEIDHYIRRAPGNILAHRFERTEVPVNVCNNGDPHLALLIEPDDMITDRLFQPS